MISNVLQNMGSAFPGHPSHEGVRAHAAGVDVEPVVERLDAEQIAQLDGMGEVDRESKISQYVEEKSSKK